MRLAEPGPARQGRPRGAGTERRVFSPEAAVRCQAGRVVSDAAPRLSAQVVEQQHRLVCFRANSSPTPCPDRCLFCLSIAHAQTRLSYSPPPQLARIHSQTDGDSDLYHEAHLRHVFTGVGRTQVNYVWCESFNCRSDLSNSCVSSRFLCCGFQ